MSVPTAFRDAYKYLSDPCAGEYRAAYHIFTSRFADDPRVWSHVRQGDGIDFDAILANGFSGGDRRLLKLADMLWGGCAEYNIGDVLMHLDDNNLRIALEALELRMGVLFAPMLARSVAAWPAPFPGSVRQRS